MQNNNTSFHSEEPSPDDKDKAIEEEDLRNKIMLKKLKEKQSKHRQFMNQIEIEKKVKQELAEEQKRREQIVHKAYLERRNASAKFRAKATNERISKMLAKIDNYMRHVQNLDTIGQIKIQAQKEYEQEQAKQNKKLKPNDESIQRLAKLNKKNTTLREENLIRRKEREEEEKQKREKLQKAKIINDKVNHVLQYGFGSSSTHNQEHSSIFKEEQTLIATNTMPPNSNEQMNLNSTNNKPRLRPHLPESTDQLAEKELRQILKDDKNSMKKLLAFQKKYTFFDISPYLHTAKMNQIKSSKTIKPTVNNVHDYHFGVTDLLVSNEDELNSTYLQSCKYNNSTYIQAHLLNAKNDTDLFTIINEKDEFGRKGIMYLIIHNNLAMIKLTLTSGILLSDCVDIYGRNIIHYCSCDNVSNDVLKVVCQCLIYENKENFNSMNRYVDKCLAVNANDENESKNEAIATKKEEYEKRIIDFDNMIANKDLVKHKQEQRKKENKNKKDEQSKMLNIKGNLNKENTKSLFGTNVINYKTTYVVEIQKNKTPLSKLINAEDIDNNMPIHYVCIRNNLPKIETLVYHNAKLDVPSSSGKLPIDLTTLEVIQQYLLTTEKNIKSKQKPNTNINDNKSFVSGMSSRYNNQNDNVVLDIEKLKFLSIEQINSFITGIENNTYLILSVLHKNFEVFKYLINTKKAKVDYVNANGCTVLHLIIQNKLYNFLSFLFKIDEEYTTLPKLKDDFIAKIYEPKDITEPNGTLTYTGQAFSILDIQKNNGHNILFMVIDLLNSIEMFQIVFDLYKKQLYLLNQNTCPLNIILNRQYGKNKQTLLIKIVEKNNLELIKYIIEHIHKKEYKFDIYQGDIHNKNILHYAVLNKSKEMIQYLIALDSDKNELRTHKDSKDKTPIDYDVVKSFTYEFTHIWDACVKNDIDTMDKLLNELKYYTINQQTPIYKNTPLHIAAKNKSDKACLLLMKLNCKKEIKNNKKETPFESVINDPRQPKGFIRKLEKILNGDISEFTELDNNISMNSHSVINGNTSKIEEGIMKNKDLRRIVERIKNEFKKRKLNVRKLFEKLDKNKNGTLEGSEFELLFTVLDIDGVSEDDVLYLNSFLDENKNGLIEYNEFLKLFEQNNNK